MKRLVKLSLATSVALASFSCANAQDLEQAIKNVDVSGTVAYRYNDYEETYNSDDSKFESASSNNYKIALNVKSQVNDDVTANTRFIIGLDGNKPASLSTHNDGDQQVNVTLSEVNFTYTGIANTSITLGKQGLATPYTIHRDSMDNEQTGTGILAVTNVGPVTLAGAYFNQTNLQDSNETTLDLKGDENIVFIGAMANFAGVNIDASYIDLDDVFDAYTIGLSAKYNVGDVKLAPYARYSSLDLDNNSIDNKLWKIGMRANMGIFGAHLGYGQTDDEGGTVGLDVSSATGYDEHWGVALSGKADSSIVYASVDAQVMPKLNVALKYSNLDDDKAAAQDEEEIYTQVTYNMSKNLSTYVRFGQYEKENVEGNKDIDSTRGRLQVQYSF
ncbi:porin [Malaciobacter marinus]|uniref:porin n=1 Tax=Malaciobacter marinus TaxID=505249 RepID=UPI003B003089